MSKLLDSRRLTGPTLGVAAALAALTLAACGGGNATSAGESNDASSGNAPTSNSTFVISRTDDPTSLDPNAEVTTGGGLETLTAFYDRLIDLNPQGGLVPGLATSWKVSPDDRTYTLKLRSGVKFHDGSPFNAAAVRYTWQRIIALNSAAAQYWTGVKNVKVVNPQTVVFQLKAPDPKFLQTLAGARGIYMGPSKQCVAKHATSSDKWAKAYFTDHECGTGPYILRSWTHDEQIVFTKNPDYWRGWAGHHATKYIEKIIKEPSTVQLLLSKGELDLAADELPIQVSQQLKKTSGVRVVSSPTATIDQISFNVDKKPFSDPRVRKAVAMLFNYQQNIQQAYLGNAQRVYGPIPSTLWPAVPADAQRFNTNVAEAKKLLAEAGYPHGFTATFATEDLDQWSNIALVLQHSLAQAGIKVNTQLTTWPVLFAKLGKPKGQKPFDMAGYVMNAAIPNPGDILMWWDTSAISVINPGWGTAASDALIHRAQTQVNHDKQAADWAKLITQLDDQVPAIWVDQPRNLTAMRTNVQGYKFNAYYFDLLDFYALSKS